MVDFLKIDLEHGAQPATVRLSDNTSDFGDIAITQAEFNRAGVLIHWMRSNNKPKEFPLLAEEMIVLCAAWQDYQGRVMQHTVTIAERKEAEQAAQTNAITEAKRLLTEAGYSLTDLTFEPGTKPNTWTFHSPLNDLYLFDKPAVHLLTDVIDYILRKKSDAILDQMDREPEQGEPEEIAEARKLLKEIMHPADWINASIYPTPNQQACPGCWTFNDGEDSLFVLPPAELLTNIHTWLQSAYAPQYAAYLERKQEHLKVKVNLQQAPAECDPTLTNEQEVAQFWASHKEAADRLFKQRTSEQSADGYAEMWSDENIAKFGNLL